MINIRNIYHDYYCQYSCDFNKMNRCQLNNIQFKKDYWRKDDKGACVSQDLTNINNKINGGINVTTK